jgi:hypothetical protein
MWEMFLIVLVKCSHISSVKNVQLTFKATGVGNLIGNKGGLLISMKIYECMFNYINVHLCHGAKRFEKRNDMISDLLKKMRIHREEIDPDVITDISFIFGDMNYRLESTFEELMPKIN